MSDKISVNNLPRHRGLGHLDRDVATVADDLGADLDQLLAQAGQRPRLRGLRHRSVRMKLLRLEANTWSWRRTALAAKERRDRRVHLIAPLPSLMYCSQVPRWL